MSTFRHIWLNILVTLPLIGLAMGQGGTPDQPVHSGPYGSPGAGMTEGVQGRVKTPDGHPLPGVLVEAQSLDRPRQPVPEVAILTDPAGRYQWPLPPGTYALSVAAREYPPQTRHVTIPPGHVVTLDFLMKPAP